ncbi:hypothetical protein DM01DRAFT_312430 [Hesseltinella vesiculosa]|uniref:Arrestin C-terminal-like domain-containing protein n=1 Tax=Hesseltinella vesiculosa TaxID=101127 RepID=A0A1X2G6N7_9FUNG|nr:hypothetical protein DM01DRAFT_312430 [Hesseltinella vesiculosa]
MTLAKIIWISGSLLYVDMAINNTSPRTICDIQLDLIRRQNTFAYIEHSKSFGLLPVTSSCETIASTHVHGQGWWQPVAPHQKDHVTLPLEIPDHVFTIKTQKLMDISYSVRIAICSDTCKEELAELPILLVHKVAMTHHPAYFEKTQASVSASSMWSTSEASDYTDFLPQVEHAEPSAPSIVTLSPPVEWMNFPVRSPRLDHSYPICTLKGRHSGKKWYNWVKQKSQGWVDKQFIMASTSCIMQPVHQKKKKPKLLRACESVLMQTKQSLLTSASVSLLVDKSKKKLISSKLQKLSTNTVAPAPTLHHGPSQKFELTNQDLELYSQSLPLRPS